MYTAYVLSDETRNALAERFPPRYDKFIGHHITEAFGVPRGTSAPDPVDVEVVGYIDSEDGLEALVASVNGSTSRPDGSIYHITWSLDPESGYKPKHSNDLLKARGFLQVRPIPITVEPAVLN